MQKWLKPLLAFTGSQRETSNFHLTIPGKVHPSTVLGPFATFSQQVPYNASPPTESARSRPFAAEFQDVIRMVDQGVGLPETKTATGIFK